MAKPLTDAQGEPLIGASQKAAALFDEAVDGFNVFRGDPVGLLDQALDDSPDFAMALILKAWLFGLATEQAATDAAMALAHEARGMALDGRARAHRRALESLLRGEWTAAAHALDRYSMDRPRDLVALQVGHNIDFFRCDARDLRDRIARALPHWSVDLPGHPIMLGMYAFGLEESGDYARAEALGREATERDPRDSWAHHAVAHVLEMEGRAAEGVAWMEGREGDWAEESSFFKVHNWWHKALYHLDLDEADRALALYDAELPVATDTMALNLLDASALLWRLTLGGVDPGDRWSVLAESWASHLPTTGYAFNDWHGAMAFIAVGRTGELEQMRRAMAAAHGSEAGLWAKTTGLTLIDGFDAFWCGDYESAVDALMPARQIAGSFGGSHAQRDVIDWTLTEAAIRGGMPGVAQAMAHERLALKPHSAINRDFLNRAEALPQPA